MYQVNIHDAKTNLSKLLKLVSKGEEVIISKGNIPLAKLIPFHPPYERKLGSAMNGILIQPDFDDPLNEFEEPEQ